MVGLLAFQIFGGRFWGISPSSYTHIGSFARQGIPATERYANAAQRKKIEQLGRTFGCHTCGSNQRFSWLSSFHFVGDHQPPKAVANQINARWYNQLLGRSVPFKFYPQCRACSNKQGSILSAAALQNSKSKNFLFSKNNNLAKAGGGRLAHFHGLRPRWNHFAGSVVAGVTVVDATDEQIAEGNPKRYRDWHRQAERFCKSLLFY